MKKEDKKILTAVFFLIIVLLLIWGIFSNFKITGNVIPGGCSDSDQGNFPETKGICFESGETIGSDNCTSTSTLKEYYCGAGDLPDEEICKIQIHDCGIGYECFEGACIISETSNCSDGTLINVCSTTKPYFCNSSLVLLENCTACGCDSGYECNESTQECFESGCSSTDTGTTLDYDFS
ncbi:MAG: hypothetical protein KJ949_00280, partial [Nanoarchaeota archaeon]|nr:hypothetical protein [Nanoarchaeota archaeon]